MCLGAGLVGGEQGSILPVVGCLKHSFSMSGVLAEHAHQLASIMIK
jgi:hypothetical protein